jgi:heme exporter protein D
MDLGPYVWFILAAYGVTVAALAGLIAWLVFDGQRQAKALAALETRGVKRRSSSAPAEQH